MKKALSTPKITASKAASPRKAPAAPKLRRTPKPIVVTEADVARRAYEIFLTRSGESGDPVSDWLQAEQELRSSI